MDKQTLVSGAREAERELHDILQPYRPANPEAADVLKKLFPVNWMHVWDGFLDNYPDICGENNRGDANDALHQQRNAELLLNFYSAAFEEISIHKNEDHAGTEIFNVFAKLMDVLTQLAELVAY